jgi:hypothetical protein
MSELTEWLLELADEQETDEQEVVVRAAALRIAMLEAVVNGLLPLIPAIENGHAIMATEYAALHRALRAAGYLKESENGNGQ